MEDRVLGALQTPDGYWRVEVLRVPLSNQQWYRVKHAETVLIEHAALGEVQLALGDQFAQLMPVDDAA